MGGFPVLAQCFLYESHLSSVSFVTVGRAFAQGVTARIPAQEWSASFSGGVASFDSSTESALRASLRDSPSHVSADSVRHNGMERRERFGRRVQGRTESYSDAERSGGALNRRTRVSYAAAVCASSVCPLLHTRSLANLRSLPPPAWVRGARSLPWTRINLATPRGGGVS